MADELDNIRALLPGVPVALVDLLGGSSRSRVCRIRAGSQTAIVKEFLGSDDAWVRERAAFSVLPREVRVPRLIAAGATPPTVIMSDLGSGPSVADALLGHDPAAATDAVMEWAIAIAGLHRATADSREPFRDALRSSAGELAVPESTLAASLEQAAGTLARQSAELGVTVPAGALQELCALGIRLSGEAGPAALTPADACPDNNVRSEAGLALIDFEGAQWRHVAWDVAYLIVPWPSCWCCWRIPSDVTERAIETYHATVGTPSADTAGFRRDVDAAAAGWAFVSTSWFLDRALLDDSTLGDPSRPAPTRRALIRHRLDQARQSTDLPRLAELAARLHDVLTARWGEVVLPYAPAFGQR